MQVILLYYRVHACTGTQPVSLPVNTDGYFPRGKATLAEYMADVSVVSGIQRGRTLSDAFVRKYFVTAFKQAVLVLG
jgi:hypothetical protein